MTVWRPPLSQRVTRRCDTHPVGTESFLEVTLFVADVARSTEFYDAIGLGMFEYHFDDMPYHADGGAGVTALQLIPAGANPISRVQLGFRVRDVGALAEKLTAIDADIEIPGPRRLRTRDPDGNRVHFSEIRRSSGSS